MRKQSLGPRAEARSPKFFGQAQIVWHGTSVASSGSNDDELDTMLDIVGSIAPADRVLVGSIFCNSEVGHCSLQLRRGNQTLVRKIANKCAAVVFKRFGSVRSVTIELPPNTR